MNRLLEHPLPTLLAMLEGELVKQLQAALQGDTFAASALTARLILVEECVKALGMQDTGVGVCTRPEGCVCGGDTERVRKACANWSES